MCNFVSQGLMNFKELIHIGEDAARATLNYRGTPEAGMLAWLDSRELSVWWKTDSAIVEPFHGGMFYVTWSEKESSRQHAIYGIMDKVDTENNIIEISKIMYISPAGKMGHLHLHISFERINHHESRMTLVHTHHYRGQLLKLYNAAVLSSWPKTFVMLKRYLETNATVRFDNI